MVVIILCYFFVQNIKLLYGRFTGSEPPVAATWILLAITIIEIPIIVLMFFKAMREYKAQKAKKEEEQKELEQHEARRRREMFFDDFEDSREEDAEVSEDKADEEAAPDTRPGGPAEAEAVPPTKDGGDATRPEEADSTSLSPYDC